RVKGTAQKQAKPLLKEDLMLVLDAMGDETRDLRNRALLLIGFAGGFRRTELVALTCRDVERVRQGMIIMLRRSNTDQTGEGRKVGIPLARGRWCPVFGLEAWLESSGIAEGPLFRPVNRHGQISVEPLSGEAVSLIVKERVRAAGIDPCR